VHDFAGYARDLAEWSQGGMSRIVGIDLGTTYSLVAVATDKRASILPNLLDSRLTPSAVRFLPDGEVVVGQAAYDARVSDARNTITGIKRFMGRSFNEVADLAERVPFDVIPGPDNRAAIRAYGREYTPEEVSAFILRHLKTAAEVRLGEPVTEAVVTVPAYFDQDQREATRKAAALAGLDVKRLLVEPTAASLAYCAEHGLRERQILVLDLGGGTFDVTVAEIGDNVDEVISLSGDNFLGGDDFDRLLADWVRDEIRQRHGVELFAVPDADERLASEVTRVRHELSALDESVFSLPFLFKRGRLTVDVAIPVSRALFDDLAQELFERMIPPIEYALRDAGKKASEIHEALLVGGATRMPRVSQIVRKIFGREPRRGANPDEAVALGAALQGGVLSGHIKDVLVLDVTRRSIGIEIVGGGFEVMVPRNSTIPTRKRETFTVLDPSQRAVEVHVLEGERLLAVDNRTIGRVVLDLATHAAARQVNVTVDIDANYKITVNVAEVGVGGAHVDLLLDYC
jgi:molecular chaperone DnaK